MLLYVLLAASTLVSEDLTCAGAGLLVTRGVLSFPSAVLSCFAGILAGDLGLFALGRLAGLRVLTWRRFQRVAKSKTFANASEWIERRGAIVILISRFTPALRLPTYLCAGFSRARLAPLLVWFVIACALWTPLLVGASVVFGREAAQRFWIVAPCVVLAWLLATRPRAFWRRLTHWEFWPAWLAYLPVMPYLLYLGWKNRSLTLFTAANPGIECGGLTGESKSRILSYLSSARDFMPLFCVAMGASAAQHVCRWMSDHQLSFPIVLKPDVGERGRDVAIVESEKEIWDYFKGRNQAAVIAQEYVAGEEFGIFYYRSPGEESGRILSITAKRFPCLMGDGERTIRELIGSDSRASCLIETYLKQLDGDRIPAKGERVELVRIGSHCRGAVFLDAGHLATDRLLRSVDYVARRHAGFYFGRFDVRSDSSATLREGRFRVLELNGVGAEAAHIYDPEVGLIDAYRSLFLQWKIAFEIGSVNRRRGHRPAGAADLIRLLYGKYWQPLRPDSGSTDDDRFPSNLPASMHRGRWKNRDRSERQVA